MNLTMQMYKKVVNTVKEFQWKAIIKDNIIIAEFCILYFDEKKNIIYVSPNMGDNYEKEIEYLYSLLGTVKNYVCLVPLGHHVYYNGKIVWNTNKDFIVALKNILFIKFGNSSKITKLVIERKYGVPLELSKPDNTPIKPIFG